jgi:hypothetical protein
MNYPNVNRTCHSAEVRMKLRIGGHDLPIAQLGPDFLILKSPTDHPPAEGEITMSIDGDISCWPVHLNEGISVSQRRTKISRGSQVNESKAG